jgi:hypothetical protein
MQSLKHLKEAGGWAERKDGGLLPSNHINQRAHLVRQALEHAEELAPCAVLDDEIQALDCLERPVKRHDERVPRRSQDVSLWDTFFRKKETNVKTFENHSRFGYS